MGGIPAGTAEAAIARLLAAGRKVAVFKKATLRSWTVASMQLLRLPAAALTPGSLGQNRMALPHLQPQTLQIDGRDEQLPASFGV